MTKNQPKIFSPSKVKLDIKKMKAYLDGKRIFPTTMEIDLTQLCTRSCPGCPYSVSRRPGLTLQLPFLDRLFSILGADTPGLVISGGEATIVPHFPQVLALARQKGFKEIAVISNGANIHCADIQDALLEHATSIRISLYDWQENNSRHFINTLDKIETLRHRIEKERSKLEIGAGLLTRKVWNHRYESVGRKAFNAGIDWLYFHPYCIDWDTEYPTQADQSGVLDAIENLQEKAPQNANIQIPVERYNNNSLHFEELHGSHFLIQIGADGINYAGPECKYEKDAALLNLNDYFEEDFLWHPQRLKRLGEINSNNYRFIRTKHRPPIFSDYVQNLIQLRENNKEEEIIRGSSVRFKHFSII